jgi:hypothetical protein
MRPMHLNRCLSSEAMELSKVTVNPLRSRTMPTDGSSASNSSQLLETRRLRATKNYSMSDRLVCRRCGVLALYLSDYLTPQKTNA